MNKKINKKLKELKDDNYRLFVSKYDESKYKRLGVRMPDLKNLVKKYVKLIDSYESYENLYEEILFEGIWINSRDISIEERFKLLDNYISKIDCWSLCDSIASSFKFKESESSKVWAFALKNIKSDEEFRIRFSILLMKKLLKNKNYRSEIIKIFKDLIKRDLNLYYVDMAIAWTMQDFYRYDKETVIEFTTKIDNVFIKRKTISKIMDSKTTSLSDKDKLRKWRDKNV